VEWTELRLRETNSTMKLKSIDIRPARRVEEGSVREVQGKK
jgi:hypothetical protein